MTLKIFSKISENQKLCCFDLPNHLLKVVPTNAIKNGEKVQKFLGQIFCLNLSKIAKILSKGF